jgi:hypothetical protein
MEAEVGREPFPAAMPGSKRYCRQGVADLLHIFLIGYLVFLD